MITKSKQKYILSLHKKKFRESYNEFLIEGSRAITSSLNKIYNIKLILYTKEFSNKNNTLIDRMNKVPFIIVDEKTIKQLSPSKNPSGILAISKKIDYKPFDTSSSLIYLDAISDPGNMGTMLRTATWFGIKQVIISKDCIDIYNPKVVQGGMGAHFYIDFIGEINLKELSNHTLIGADQKGDSISSLKVPKNWGLIMGSEAHGISEKTKFALKKTIAVKRLGNGESLNVGVAMGILLHKMTQ